MDGVVVHARGGERNAYRPIRTPLADGCRPEAVLAGLLRLHPFRTVYIADLDAIQGRGDQAEAIGELHRRFPELRFWVDAGFAEPERCRRFLAGGRGDLVLGSESQNDAALLVELGLDARVVLSLDSRGEQTLDPARLASRPELWPERVVAMTLGSVGGRAGPDLDRLAQVRALAPDRRIYAAGGVRGAQDLAALARLGAAGVLVASALHDGRLGSADLARFT